MEEMPLLERHFVARFAAEYGKEIRGLTHRARCRLAQHSWPGNVREFERAGPCGHDGEQRQDRRTGFSGVFADRGSSGRSRHNLPIPDMSRVSAMAG
jgi:hypothetical protein